MDRQQHWDRVYTSKAEHEVSWFEAAPGMSLRLMEAAGLTSETCVLDVGGGASRLVDALVTRGLTCLAVLDVSSAALQRAQSRLGESKDLPVWIHADVTSPWYWKPVDIWHDRAVFHFMTDPQDRSRYLERLRDTLKPGGSAIIATFDVDGPERCSGLPVARYSAALLAEALGDPFTLIESIRHRHQTPAGIEQSFEYSRFVRRRA